MKKAFSLLALFILFSCTTKGTVNTGDDISWYLSPTQNDSGYIYGVGQGYTLEEATKSALSDASARLSTTISSTSTSLMEENRYDVNEEFRQKINQNIEKIEFPNFQVTKSAKKDASTYVEVSIDRKQFVDLQKEKIEYLDNQINNIKGLVDKQNIIQKRSSYNKIIDLGTQSEILTRVIYGASNKNLKQKLKTISDAKYRLSKLNNSFEFYFLSKGNSDIYRVIQKHLNQSGVSIATAKTNLDNQIIMKIASSSTTGEVYGAFITKLKINFKNYSGNKVVASNNVEVSGSSTISRNESHKAAIASLDEKIQKDGIFKVLGVE